MSQSTWRRHGLCFLNAKPTCWTKLYMHICHGKSFLFPWARVSITTRDPESVSKHGIWTYRFHLHSHTFVFYPENRVECLLMHSLRKFVEVGSMPNKILESLLMLEKVWVCQYNPYLQDKRFWVNKYFGKSCA